MKLAQNLTLHPPLKMKQALVEKLLRSTFLLLDLLADLITTAEHHDSSLTLLAECVEILRPHQLRE